MVAEVASGGLGRVCDARAADAVQEDQVGTQDWDGGQEHSDQEDRLKADFNVPDLLYTRCASSDLSIPFRSVSEQILPCKSPQKPPGDYNLQVGLLNACSKL